MEYPKAHNFNVKEWVDSQGKKRPEVKLSDFKNRFKVIFCFQSACPGCHIKGFPDLKKIIDANIENIVFLSIQTVFEDFDKNTYEQMLETQKKYDLKIPFGHDAGKDGKSTSLLMKEYKTGGTPWFIFIDQNDHIVFSDFHLDPDAAISYLNDI